MPPTIINRFAKERVADIEEGFNLPAQGRGERLEKYNQLMRIEEYLGASAVYAGCKAFVR